MDDFIKNLVNSSHSQCCSTEPNSGIAPIINYLEDEDILSPEILALIDRITTTFPGVVFGGSIALNAVGVIKRKIRDIDIMCSIDSCLIVKIGTELKKYENAEELSEIVSDINGVKILRNGYNVDGVHVCVFVLPSVTASEFTFSGRKIQIQNVSEAILAKRAWSGINSKSKIKHLNDICEIEKSVDAILGSPAKNLIDFLKELYVSYKSNNLEAYMHENILTLEMYVNFNHSNTSTPKNNPATNDDLPF